MAVIKKAVSSPASVGADDETVVLKTGGQLEEGADASPGSAGVVIDLNTLVVDDAQVVGLGVGGGTSGQVDAELIDWPIDVVLRNNSGFALAEPTTGKFLAGGGNEHVLIQGPEQMSRLQDNIAELERLHGLPAGSLVIDGLPAIEQKD